MLHLLPVLLLIEVSSVRPRKYLETSCSSKVVGPCHSGSAFFSSVAVWREVSNVSEAPEVQGLRHQWPNHFLLHALMPAAQVVGPLHLHLRACLVHEWDMLVFPRTWQRLHVSLFGRPDRSLDLVVGWYVRLFKSNAMCPLVKYSAGEENKQKLDMWCWSSPWGSSSIVIPIFLTVSSTSVMIEHDGVVGKCMMQLFTQISVSKYANTKNLS